MRDDFVDLHPSLFGQALYFRTIRHFFETMWKDNPSAGYVSKSIPVQPLDPYSYANGSFEPLLKAKLVNNWKYINKWEPEHNVNVREGFVNDPILEASQRELF